MTQEQLAQQLTAEGLPTRQNTIAKLEGGQRPTTVAEFGALAKIFNMSVQELAASVFPAHVSEEELAAMRTELDANVDIQFRIRSSLEDIAIMESELRAEHIRLGLRESLLRAFVGDDPRDKDHGAPELRETFEEEVQFIVEKAKRAMAGEPEKPVVPIRDNRGSSGEHPEEA